MKKETKDFWIGLVLTVVSGLLILGGAYLMLKLLGDDPALLLGVSSGIMAMLLYWVYRQLKGGNDDDGYSE